jgi:dipeptidyl aminopeptidase/acylaminoacyl peptidase
MNRTASWPLILVLAASVAGAQTRPAVLAPGDNLIVEGIAPIPADLVETVGRYTEFRSAGMSSWHPTAREMLINTRFGDTAQVHHVKFPGGARTQLTFYPDRVGGGAFEPTKGESFIFGKDTGGGEFFQGYRYDLPTGDVTMFTDGKSRNTSFQWSNDGSKVVYNSTRRNGRDTDFYTVDPKNPASNKLLVQVEGGGWGATDWSPDDRQLLIGQAISINESYIHLINVSSGEKTLLTPKDANKQVAYGIAKFSKDGKGVYLTTDLDSEFRRLAHLDLATKKYTFLTDDIKWDVDEVELSDDGKILAFVTNEAGVDRLHLLDTATRKRLPSPQLPVGLIGGLEWHKNNRDLGFTFSTARTPGDAHSLDVTSGKVERWTFSETGGINTANFAEARVVKWKSFDNLEISGFLYAPPPKFTGKRPVIINIHGGPEGQARPSFLGRGNYFLNELGVAMLFPNIRGSSGYGKTFVKLDNGVKREDSYKDIGALLDWIKTQPDLDGDRIMVTGGSYGGHMTFAVATLYSDKVRAFLPVVGMSNLRTFLERTESYRRDLRRVEYGDERDPAMREFMERTAPLNHAAKITRPIFIVQGANDPRVPLNEATQMKERIQSNGSPVWYLVAKDEGHGFAKKKNADFQFYATVMFVKEYLLN